MKKLIVSFTLLACLGAKSQTVLVNQGASWKYLDNGSDQGTAWAQTSFNDASWASGNAELGYGDSDETTTVGYGSNPLSKHITTYFRHTFNVANPAIIGNLVLRLLRDDGAIVYLNGTEIARSNMPSGTVDYQTDAASTINGSDESTWYDYFLGSSLLVTGANVIAVEIHQSGGTSSDISFDLKLEEVGTPLIVRGPYIQMLSGQGAVLRWRTDFPSTSEVNTGTDLTYSGPSFTDATLTSEHQITLSGFNTNTRYYYQISHSGTALTPADSNHYIQTNPLVADSTIVRMWALGDAGTANNNQRAVRDAFYNRLNNKHLDMILLLGDNAYDDGTDAEYQYAVFENMYEEMLTKTALWSCPGNHDIHSADSDSESGPYYDIFTFPKNAECGGVASGVEPYYSYDYGDVHVISLDSDDSDRSTSGAMYNWLVNDLASTTARWIVAIWHHPPYTKGSHDSDLWLDGFGRHQEMRENFMPLLEDAGVDLVLNGHSHSYERSFLMHGHYNSSSSLTAAMVLDMGSGRPNTDCAYKKETTGSTAGDGAVYIVTGSAGKTSGGSLDHPAHFISLDELGSCFIEVEDNEMRVEFIRENGSIDDYFTIIKDPSPAITCPQDTNITIPSGQSGIAVDYPAPAGNAPYCSGSILSQTDGTGLSDGSTFPIGTTVQTYTFTDGYGNTASCSFNITVAVTSSVTENITIKMNFIQQDKELHIQNSGNHKGNLHIYDVTGAMVKQVGLQPGQQKINLQNLTPGIYTAAIDGTSHSVKFLLE
jgi:hypothetical protein